VKKIFFDLKSWGPLKNFKIRSGSYTGLALSIYVKNKIKISLDCPFKAVQEDFLAKTSVHGLSDFGVRTQNVGLSKIGLL
jgi:hypothetical protein